KAGNQHISRVIALQLWRLVRPAHGREGPKGRGEPGVQHVRITDKLDRLAIVLLGRCLGFVLVVSNESLVVRTIPGRNLMAPPQLARNAPRLDVLEPGEIGV